MLNNHNLQTKGKRILDGVVPTGVEESRTSEENAQDAAVTQMFASLKTSMNSYGKKIRHILLSMQCHDTRHHLVNLKATKQISPSQVLNTLLNEDQFASVSVGGHLQRMPCVKVDAEMKATLKVGEDRFASKPVFEVTIGGKKREAQWTNEKYLRIGVRDFQPPGVNASYVFKIRDRTYMFKNGDLYHSKPKIETLSLTSHKLDLKNQVK